MSVIIIPAGITYIKKDDAAKSFNNHLKGQVVVGIAYSAINLFFIFFLSNKIVQTCSKIFTFVQQNVFIGTLMLIAGIVVYWLTIKESFSQEYKEEYFRKLSKYDEKEMINFNKLVDTKRYWRGVGIYGITLIVGLILYIFPVFLGIFLGTNL